MLTPVAGNVTQGDASPYALARAVEAGRDLGADVFDRYMWNTIQLGVPSLGRYLAAVRRDRVPHLVRKPSAAAAGGSLLLPIPGTTFAFELMADTGLEAETAATVWDVCSAR